jgi:hypothetical protein
MARREVERELDEVLPNDRMPGAVPRGVNTVNG